MSRCSNLTPNPALSPPTGDGAPTVNGCLFITAGGFCAWKPVSAPSVPEQQAPLERVHLPRSISAPPGRLVRDGSAPAALAAGQLRGFCTRRDKPFARGAGSVSGSVGDEERKVLQIVLGPLSSSSSSFTTPRAVRFSSHPLVLGLRLVTQRRSFSRSRR